MTPRSEEELNLAIRDATIAVNSLEQRLVEETEERQKQGRRTKIGLAVGALFIVLTLVGLVRANTATNQGKEATKKANALILEIKQDTVKRVQRACDDSADVTRKLIITLKSGHRVIIETLIAASNQPVTPELKAAAESYYKKSDADIDGRQLIRDCSPEAIEKTVDGRGYTFLPPSAAPQLPTKLNL